MLPSKSLCYLVIMGNAVMLVSYSIQGENALVRAAEALLPRQRSSSLPYQRASVVVAPIVEEVLTPLATEVATAIVVQAVTPPTLEVSGELLWESSPPLPCWMFQSLLLRKCFLSVPLTKALPFHGRRKMLLP